MSALLAEASASFPMRILPLVRGANFASGIAQPHPPPLSLTANKTLSKYTTHTSPLPLYAIDATRRIEESHAAVLPPHTLMQRAGEAVARMALALWPHAQTIWIAAGPGNNGGDGLEAACHLRRMGKTVVLTWLGSPERCSADTLTSFKNAKLAGFLLEDAPPAKFDLAIDALLGIGASTGARLLDGQVAAWAQRMNASGAPILAIDLPSGINADTGAAALHSVRASHTLSLVTLKPGLFTGHGRDLCGEIWFDPLGCQTDLSDLSEVNEASELGDLRALAPICAHLSHASPASRTFASHLSHKGSFGDVAVIGGAPGMTGAALLAARTALHAGAGRVLVGLLDGGSMVVDPAQPELMFRRLDGFDFNQAVVVCGCGGGDVVRAALPQILSTAPSAVLDADALNAIAQDTSLQALLIHRKTRGRTTVLTPHPLEAARLLGYSTGEVQANRLEAAGQLAARFACIVVLKGSGTVIAAPGQVQSINPTGNARLATAGTGDVLAGMIGATLARNGGAKFSALDWDAAFDATAAAVYRHGQLADQWPPNDALTASALASRA